MTYVLCARWTTTRWHFNINMINNNLQMFRHLKQSQVLLIWKAIGSKHKKGGTRKLRLMFSKRNDLHEWKFVLVMNLLLGSYQSSLLHLYLSMFHPLPQLLFGGGHPLSLSKEKTVQKEANCRSHWFPTGLWLLRVKRTVQSGRSWTTNHNQLFPKQN